MQDELQVEHRGERMPGNSSRYEVHRCSQDERFQKTEARYQFFMWTALDSAAVSIFVVILVELTNTVFVNSTNITTNIKEAVLSRLLAELKSIQ